MSGYYNLFHYLSAGGFKYSSNIKSALIDHYIPFFPLERRHVEMCIKQEFVNLNVFTPSDEQIE